MDNHKYRRIKANNPKKDLIKQITNCIKNEGKGFIKSDVGGSYTGMGVNYEDPVQDADDL